MTLAERAAELGALHTLVDEACAGGAAVALVEGPAGTGKSALLAAAAQHGRRQGLTVLRATCCGLERGFAFGAARQLLEPPAAAAAPAERARLLDGPGNAARAVFEQVTRCGGPDAQLSAAFYGQLHGLYAVLSRLAERAPVLLVVDDAHEADLCSQQWLAYVLRRLPGSRVSLAVAARTGESGAADPLTAELAARPDCLRLHPAPLSPTAAAECLSESAGVRLAPEVLAVCAPAAGGNPRLLRALAGDLARGDLARHRSPERITEVTARCLIRHVPALLGRHSPPVLAVATALAAVERTTRPLLLRELAGLDDAAVAGAVTVLEQTGLLRPGPPWRLCHSLVREALLAHSGTAAVADLRSRAVRTLAGLGGAAAEAADLLLVTEPEGDVRRVGMLCTAAQQALDRGVPDTAAAYLRRALREPPPADRRSAVLTQLGVAELSTAPAAAAEHLRGALDATADAKERARITPCLAEALTRTGRAGEAVGLLDSLAAGIPETDREALYGVWAQGILLLLEETPRLADAWISRGGIGRDLAGDTAGQRFVLATLALKATLAGEGAESVTALARRALARFVQPADPALTGAFCVVALLHADRLDEAAHWLRELSGTAAETPIALRSLLLALRTRLDRLLGDLNAAVAHGRQAVGLAEADQRYRPYAAAELVHALLELADVPEADRVCRQPFDVPVGNHWSWTPLLAARARLRLAQGHPEAALADLEECGRRQTTGGYDNPALVPWRSEAALIHRRLGDPATAVGLAREEVELARAWGGPRCVGTALRVLGLLQEGPAALAALREAVALLESTPARIDRARAAADLGQALFRAGHTEEARRRLRQALDLATATGVAELTDSAHRALLATGARPRRKRQSGPAALTARERDVVMLAAGGRGNQEIAAELYITRRTVEFHLTRAFRKLGVRGRRDLGRVLDDRD